MVEFTKVRRLIILAMAFSLFGLGPVPLSACALLTFKIVECTTPKTESWCDLLIMEPAGTRHAAASDGSCCTVSQAPVPQSERPRLDPVPAVSIVDVDLRDEAPLVQTPPQAILVQALSPPSVQSLLCTFLI